MEYPVSGNVYCIVRSPLRRICVEWCLGGCHNRSSGSTGSGSTGRGWFLMRYRRRGLSPHLPSATDGMLCVRRSLLRHPWSVALFGLIGGVLLARAASADTGSGAIAPSQPEYTLGDTVVIYGQGFAPGSSVIVEVIRVNGWPIVTGNGTETPGSDTVTASASGTFTYYYLIEGGPPAAYDGTLTVNANDASTLAVLATTSVVADHRRKDHKRKGRKESPQFMFQGCSKERGDCSLDNPATGWADGAGPMTGWTSGNLKGWFELDNVPFRLRIGLRDAAPDGIPIYVMNEHDNLRDGV